MTESTALGRLRIVPANEASWADVQAVFGARGEPHRCQCLWFKQSRTEFRMLPQSERELRQREYAHCGDPSAETTAGLVAYLDGEPAGWVAVEPRSNYLRMRTQRIPWLGRVEDKDDPSVWSVTCFVVRVRFRGRGLMRVLARAAADFARARGATAIEGYPLVLRPGERLGWGELYVGSSAAFAAAGFGEVSRPSDRRAVMRIDFRARRDGEGQPEQQRKSRL